MWSSCFFSSTMVCMRSIKRVVSSLALILLVASFAVAANTKGAGIWVDYRPGLSGSFGGAFTVPTKEYLSQYPGDPEAKMPSVRTSYGYGFDLRLLDICIGSGVQGGVVDLGAGVSFTGIGRSLPYGASILKAYSGVGAFLSLNASFDGFEVATAAKLYICRFNETRSSFLAGEIEVSPSIPIVTGRFARLSVALPASILFKTDAVVLRLSCGVRLDYSTRGFKEVMP